MAFDQPTRNRLASFVGKARALLTEEFTRQLQYEYGLDPAGGEVAELAKLTGLDDARRETARRLRDTLAHYLGCPADKVREAKKKERQETLDRIVREQAFTVLNRLCALRMAEARGLLLESVAQGYQSKGFQLYARLAGTALGETGDAYRTYLFSLFDELAVDLPVLFDRFSPAGPALPARGGAAGAAGPDQRPGARGAVGRGRDHRLDLPVLQRQGRAQGDARRIAGAAQQPRAGRAQPVLHPALRGRVPDRQHPGPHLVRDDAGAKRA